MMCCISLGGPLQSSASYKVLRCKQQERVLSLAVRWLMHSCGCAAGERHRDNVLQAIGSSLEAWVTQVKREKAVYHVLNMCSVDVTRKVLVAEAWCPVSAKQRVQEALREAAHTTSARSVSPPLCSQSSATVQCCLCFCRARTCKSVTRLPFKVGLHRRLSLGVPNLRLRESQLVSNSGQTQCCLHTRK